MYRVVSSSPTFGKYSQEAVDLLKENNCELIFLNSKEIDDDKLFAKALSDADAIIVGIEIINEYILSQTENLKIIAKHGIGIDNIDLEAAKKRNIQVKNVNNANKDAVADYTIGLMISSARHIPKTYELVKEDVWKKTPGLGIANKTLGVIGTGQIGKAVIERAKGFNMKVVAHDKMPDVNYSKSENIEYVDLKTLYNQADFITIHTNLDVSTKGLIDELAFKEMKRNAILINTARGGIIQESSLLKALDDGLIAGAAMDVFEEEPNFNHELFKHDRFVASSHTAAYTYESLEKMGLETVQNVLKALI